MIDVEHLSKHFGTKKAVNDISFSIKEGEIVGFLGPNGAGKSTTMNMLTGYTSSTAGKIRIDGHDVLADPMGAKRSIGYLPELPPLYPDMTVDEYLEFVYDLKKATQPRSKHLKQVKELATVSDVSGRLIRNLSKGYRQRVGFAQALVGDPKVLILDEPTIGLDPTQIVEIRKTIRSLGKTVIFSSHILPEISAVCGRIIIINNGKIVAQGSNDDLAHAQSGFRYQVQLAARPAAALPVLQAVEAVTLAETVTERDTSCDYIVEGTKDVRPALFYALAAADMPILQLKSAELTLEEIFINTVSGVRKEGKE